MTYTYEDLLLWKGQLILEEYFPNKRARFGIQIFSLCGNGYLRNSFLYFGKNEKPDPEEKQFKRRIQKSGAIVISFIKELFQHGYNLYIDNCHTSQSLFRYPDDHDKQG